jgi:hypothetical protein
MPSVTASTMIALSDFGHKVRCHKGAVETNRGDALNLAGC